MAAREDQHTHALRPYLMDIMLRGPNQLPFCLAQKKNENWIT